MSLQILENYESNLDGRETERAIKFINYKRSHRLTLKFIRALIIKTLYGNEKQKEYFIIAFLGIILLG